MPITIPMMNDGEYYAGLVIVEGKPMHYLVVLPGELVESNWKNAMEWAKEQCGDLPTPREQALCYANAPEAFRHAWYWSNAHHASDAGYAYGQHFGTGYQNDRQKDIELCARAVRRVPI